MMPRPVLLQRAQQASAVRPVHHMNDEDDIRHTQVALNLAPLILVQLRTEIVSSKTQLKLVLTVNLPLSLPERRK